MPQGALRSSARRHCTVGPSPRDELAEGARSRRLEGLGGGGTTRAPASMARASSGVEVRLGPRAGGQPFSVSRSSGRGFGVFRRVDRPGPGQVMQQSEIRGQRLRGAPQARFRGQVSHCTSGAGLASGWADALLCGAVACEPGGAWPAAARFDPSGLLRFSACELGAGEVEAYPLLRGGHRHFAALRAFSRGFLRPTRPRAHYGATIGDARSGLGSSEDVLGPLGAEEALGPALELLGLGLLEARAVGIGRSGTELPHQ